MVLMNITAVVDSVEIGLRKHFPDSSNNNSSYLSSITIPIAVLVVGILVITLIRKKLARNRETNAEANQGVLNIVDKIVIGRGSFGIVYKAIIDSKVVAVKVTHSSKYTKFETERDILYSHNDHDNILNIIGHEMKNSRGRVSLHLILEYIESGCLRSYLATNSYNLDSGIFLLNSFISGITYLHSKLRMDGSKKISVVHRDIKSANILLSPKKGCIIADFGLAMRIDHAAMSRRTHHHLCNTQVGTPRYMSPEKLFNQFEGDIYENILYKIDIYAMGLVCYEILTRCNLYNKNKCQATTTYVLPFSNVVGCKPSIPEMKEVVVNQNVRPTFELSWKLNNTMHRIQEMIEICWHANHQMRPFAQNALQTIENIKQEYINE